MLATPLPQSLLQLDQRLYQKSALIDNDAEAKDSNQDVADH